MKPRLPDPYTVKCAGCNKDMSIKDVVDNAKQPWKKVPDHVFTDKYYCEKCQKSPEKQLAFLDALSITDETQSLAETLVCLSLNF